VLTPPPDHNRTRRDTLAAVIMDMVSDLLYYDRKEDEDLPRGAIEEMIARDELTVNEMVELFQSELEKVL